MDEADEVPLVESSPDSDSEAFVWMGAYRVGDLPALHVGRPSEQFMEDAHRDPSEADGLICSGANGGYGCEEAPSRGNDKPIVFPANFGGEDVLAWLWFAVPDDAAAVVFTDPDGTTTWQRPVDDLVIFANGGDPDGHCECRLDALDSSGETLASVDLLTGEYVDG